MNKKICKLVNDTAWVLKLLENYSSTKVFSVRYDLINEKAYIFWTQNIISTGNGHERTYNWSFLEQLVKLCSKKNISYKIGHTDNIELHIQIYV